MSQDSDKIQLSTSRNKSMKHHLTRRWANAQRDGRPAEYRWRSLFTAAKFGWRPLLECCAVSLPRCETRWISWGAQTNEPLSAAIILWGHVREKFLFNKFFPIVDTWLSSEDTARQSCVMVPRWRIFKRFFCVLYFRRATCSTYQTCILNSH